MNTTATTLPVDGGALPVTHVEPDGDAPVPYLVVVPSIFGVTPDLIEQLGELGAGVLAMDPFWRVEPGPLPYDQLDKAFERVGPLDRKASYGDFVALLEWARQQPRCNGRVIALGICFGGPFCLLASADGLLDGLVTWHGSRMGQFLDRAAEMRCPMKHHIGGSDPVVPPGALEALRGAFAGREDVELVVHEGAAHGFSHRGAPAHVEAAERAGLDACRTLLAG